MRCATFGLFLFLSFLLFATASGHPDLSSVNEGAGEQAVFAGVQSTPVFDRQGRISSRFSTFCYGCRGLPLRGALRLREFRLCGRM